LLGICIFGPCGQEVGWGGGWGGDRLCAGWYVPGSGPVAMSRFSRAWDNDAYDHGGVWLRV
jgi:hypothetical protein